MELTSSFKTLVSKISMWHEYNYFNSNNVRFTKTKRNNQCMLSNRNLFELLYTKKVP